MITRTFWEKCSESSRTSVAHLDYLFQGRPTAGNEPYEVPLVRGWQIFTEAVRHGSGLAQRARFVMSHETGKIEIVSVDQKHIYLRYLRSKYDALRGEFRVYHRNDDAYWLDQLVPIGGQETPKTDRAISLPILDSA